MFLDLRQKPILTQKLIMTPQLQQAIKLLQLSRAELVETVRQELAENPAPEKADVLGVRTRDLRGCLLLQLRRSHSANALAVQIVTGCLEQLAKRDFRAMSKALGVKPQN